MIMRKMRVTGGKKRKTNENMGEGKEEGCEYGGRIGRRMRIWGKKRKKDENIGKGKEEG